MSKVQPRQPCQWRSLPACFPPSSAVYYWFAHWQSTGTLQQLNEASNRADWLGAVGYPPRRWRWSMLKASNWPRAWASSGASTPTSASAASALRHERTHLALACARAKCATIAGRPGPYGPPPRDCGPPGPAGSAGCRST
ncbi:transposase [Hymenobacter amundsenii]|uniref:transposase n=1 Tax=Hymenobacter amundsenii TaxID=2006685 RepID=UPI0013FD3E3D